MKLTGAKAHVNFDVFNEENVTRCTGGNVSTRADTWYQVIEKGAGSNLPLKEGFWFKSPSGNQQIPLVAGDVIYEPSPDRVCKTSASLSAEEGTVDVGDDCDPGAFILDNIPKISGNLAGFFRYNDVTQEFDNVTRDVLSRFFDTVDDDSAGVYEFQGRSNTQAQMMILLNSDAAAGSVEHWLILPVIISSMSMSLGNTDVQNKDLSWSKGEGPAVVYNRVKTA
jgi:hypothetical protein